MLKILDRYIIRKFLGTFFLSIALIISVAVAFDVTEKLDDFMENNAPLNAIIFDYYLNFIPYYANLFSPLFTFIAVIFFTSKLSENSEIIAIFASGIKFSRFIRPYMIAAGIIAIGTFILVGYVIPPANKDRLDFQEEYVKKKRKDHATKVQMKVTANEILFIDYYDQSSQSGRRASFDIFDGKTLKTRLTALDVYWMGGDTWRFDTYTKRDFDGLYEHIRQGESMQIELNIMPEDFFVFSSMQEQMTNPELKHYISRQKSRGADFLSNFEIEYAKRYASSFSFFILTIIGVSLSSKKKKGGMGLNLGLGLLLSLVFIAFGSVSSTFAISGQLPILVAVWMPNVIFAVIAFLLYRRARQ